MQKINPANIISIARVAATYASILLASINPIFFAASLVVVVSASELLDGIDGRVARRLGLDDEVGKLVDLYSDHMVANAFWTFFMSIGLVPLWVPILAATRDFAVDLIRQVGYKRTGLNGFEQVANTRWGWLSASRPMRFSYGALKAVTWLLGFLVLGQYINISIKELSYVSVLVCYVRAIPYFQSGWRHLVFAPDKRTNSSSDETQGPERINGSFFYSYKKLASV